MLKSVVVTVLGILPLVCSAANDRAEQLRPVSSIYISGNNQAAEGARQTVTAGKTCFTLAAKADAADAVLEVAAESQSMGGTIGGMGGRSSVVSGTLTLRSGALVWSRSERASDSPLTSGAKSAGGLLVRHLAEAAACRQRQKSGK